ncbi:MAG: CheR family methyltransferase [Archangium sp.]
MSTETAQPLFTILKTLVEARAGLHYGPEEQELFLARVTARADEAGFESLLDYYYFLRYDDAGAAELERLVDTLVVNETFFFRELQPLELIVERLLPPIIASGRRPRVWSAACATGEEPYTLAMLLAEREPLSRVELIGSDISTRALQRAKSGSFGRRSLRDSGESRLTARWLQPGPDGTNIDPMLRDAINWQRINLTEPSPMPPASCDVILCRNVLIYFSDETTARVVRTLTQALRPGGVLFVGVAESLLRFGSSLECQELDHVFLYRKPS